MAEAVAAVAAAAAGGGAGRTGGRVECGGALRGRGRRLLRSVHGKGGCGVPLRRGKGNCGNVGLCGNTCNGGDILLCCGGKRVLPPLCPVLARACGEGGELHFCARGLIPSAREIDARGDRGGDAPANRPRPPYALYAEDGVEHEAQRDADDEVGERREHEGRHALRAAEHGVEHDFAAHGDVERRDDGEEAHARRKRSGAAVFEKEGEHGLGRESVSERERHHHDRRHREPRESAAFCASEFARAEVLRREVGQPARDRGEGCDDEGVELDRRRVAREHGRAVAVDEILYEQVAHRDHALLDDAGDGDIEHLPEEPPRKHGDFVLAGETSDAPEHGDHAHDARRALADESRPREPRDAHGDDHREEEVHAHVRDAGRDEEDERGAAVTERGIDARADVVDEHEEETADVDIEIAHRVVHDVGGGVEHLHERPSRAHAHRGQRRAEHDGGDHDRGHAGLQVAVILLPEKLGRHRRATEVEPERHRGEYHRDGIGRADGGKRLLAEHLACNDAVRHVIKLLEDRADEDGQTEEPQNFGGSALREILVHSVLSFAVPVPAPPAA